MANEGGGSLAAFLGMVALVGWGLHSCSTGTKPSPDPSTFDGKVAAMTGGSNDPSVVEAAVAKLDASREFDEDGAKEAAASALAGETYESSEGSTNCSGECDGHNAGWKWAVDHQLTDGCDQNGESEPFDEGCQAYSDAIQQRVDEAETKFNDGDDTFKKKE